MATSAINLPAGFVLEQPTEPNLPPGFVLEQPSAPVEEKSNSVLHGLTEEIDITKAWDGVKALLRHPETTAEKVMASTGTLVPYRLIQGMFQGYKGGAEEVARRAGKGEYGAALSAFEQMAAGPLGSPDIEQMAYEGRNREAIGHAIGRAATLALPYLFKLPAKVRGLAPESTKIAGVEVPLMAQDTVKGVRGSMEAMLGSSAAGGPIQARAEAQSAAIKAAEANTAQKLSNTTRLNSPINVQNARQVLSTAETFGDAAQEIRDFAQPVYEQLDNLVTQKIVAPAKQGAGFMPTVSTPPKIAKWSFTKAKDEIAELKIQYRRATEPKVRYDLQQTIAAKEKELRNNIRAAGPQAEALYAEADKLWKQSRALDQLDKLIFNSTQGIMEDISPIKTTAGRTISNSPEKTVGTRLLKGLRQMDRDGTLMTALGGSLEHRNTLYNISQLLSKSEMSGRYLNFVLSVQPLLAIGATITGNTHLAEMMMATASGNLIGAMLLSRALTSTKGAKTLAALLEATPGTGRYASLSQKMVNEIFVGSAGDQRNKTAESKTRQ